MKKIFNKYIITIFMCFALALSLIPSVNFSHAEPVLNKINYLSIGDSIAEGDKLPGYVATNTIKTNFTPNSYAQKFKQMLEQKFTAYSVSSYSYAKSGESTTSFLEKLNKEAELQFAIASADIITISLGANDILGPAIDNLVGFIMFGFDISINLNEGVNIFTTNFTKIINKINGINPNAIKIFTNVYNPYKPLITMNNSVKIMVEGSEFGLLLPKEKLNLIGTMADDFIAGNQTPGLYGLEQGVYGLNQRMADILKSYENCYLIDSKPLFDEYEGDYSDIINSTLHHQTELTISSFDNVWEVVKYIDPHPTALGHSMLFNNFQQAFNENINMVEYDCAGGKLNGQANPFELIKHGQKIGDINERTPIKNLSTFMGWYKNADLTEIWDMQSPVTEDMVLYAKWSNKYVVTFNSVGGTMVTAQELLAGEKVVKPEDPRKIGSTDVFAGWYYSGPNSQKIMWNFENDIITKNITLIALWVNSVCTTTSLLTQMANNVRPATFKIDIENAYIQWYVNDEVQIGQNGQIFEFNPPAQTGTYSVYCVVNGKETKRHIVTITPYIPEEIKIIITSVTDNNLFEFSIEGGNYLDADKCKWFATMDLYSSECEEIGTGATCTVRLARACNVFVRYGEEYVQSNLLSIKPETPISNYTFIILGALAGVAAFVVLIVILSRRRYHNSF